MDRRRRVLLVEDDPVSSTVFTFALERTGARVDACGCLRTALEAAARATYDLWLVDAHLPDGDGIGLLIELQRGARMTPAIAHTASRDVALHAQLRAAGFREVLVKPLTATELVAAVARPWAADRKGANATAGRHEEHWDDAQALRALGGRRDSLEALRRLFRQELPDALVRCRKAMQARDAAALHAVLHRLQASAAFVGATALAGCLHALRDAPGPSTLAAFEREVQALLGTVDDWT